MPARTGTKGRSTSRKGARKQDAIALLKEDHREVKQMFKRFKALGDTALKSKKTLVSKMVRELSIHASIEEQALYPVVRAALPDGEKLVKEALKEHQEAKATLAELDKMAPDDEGYDDEVLTLIEEVDHHVKEEEQEMFPKFRKAIAREDLIKMGDQMRKLKKVVPTRPHPKAPNKPPGNVIAGIISGMTDRARDAVRKRSA
jgi:hemerythrin-like domain-containing protein